MPPGMVEPVLSPESAHIVRILGRTVSFKGIIAENEGETGILSIAEATELCKINV